MKSLFANPTFCKLFAAAFASQLGTVIGNMAFAFYLLDRFSSQPAYASLAELMYALPTLAVFMVVGVLADRLDRQKIAENCDWIRAGLTLLLLAAVTYDWLLLAFILLFLRSAVSKFFAPAETALLQGILPKDQYDQAAGLNQMVFGVFMLFGVALGAASYHLVGIQGAVILDGISFLVSGILIRLCRIDRSVRQPNGPIRLSELRPRELAADFMEGLRYIRSHRLLTVILSGFFLFGFINGCFAVLPMFTMKYKLAPEHYQQTSSLFAIVLGIGFLVGSGIGSLLVKKLPKHVIIISGILISGLMVPALAAADRVWIYLVLVGMMGCILAPINIAIGGWLPEIVDADKMGRVSAWIDPIMMLAQSAALGFLALCYPRFVNLTAAYLLIAGALLAVYLVYQLLLPQLARQQRAAAASGGDTAPAAPL